MGGGVIEVVTAVVMFATKMDGFFRKTKGEAQENAGSTIRGIVMIGEIVKEKRSLPGWKLTFHPLLLPAS